MIKTSDEKQLTLKSAFKLKGRALHSGMDIEVCVKPAPAGSGISFKRTDQADARSLQASLESINGSAGKGRQTTLGSGQESVSTIEHLMAAFHGMGVDNASVEVFGPEIPGLDGSADEICQAIERVGLEAQERAREYLQVEEPVALNFSNASVVILPAEDFKISYTLNYSSGALDDQFFEESITPEKFRQEIAPARTFVLKEEAEALMAAGYGKGADFGNTLVFENNQPMNNELRFPNEAARHKVLDLIGDLYLLGRRIKGHVIASRTGHAQNLKIVQSLKNGLEKSMNSEQNNEHMTSKELNINHIKKILPHRYPFLFVDKVTILEEGVRAVGIKNVTVNDYFFQGHFPGHPVMPGVLIVEALAQAAGVVLLRRKENFGKLAYFMSIDKIKFRSPVVPGDQLRLEVLILKCKSKVSECEGKAFVGDKLVCEAILRFAIVDR